MVVFAVEPPATNAGPDLFLAIGGRPGVSVIVDRLYDRLERDPRLARMFASRRAGERNRQKVFFEMIFGGAPLSSQEVGVGVQRRHLHRLISCDESELWLAHFDAALNDVGVDANARVAVMQMLRGSAARLVNDGAPKSVLRQALASAGRGDVDSVDALMAIHPRLIDQRGGDGVTMLWAAARAGRLPVVRNLVTAGADIEIPGSAVHASQVMVSPYCIAVRSGRAAVAGYLHDHGARVDVFCAAFLGDLRVLREHIRAGRANARSPYEDFSPVTPLHHAVDGGSAAAAILLLESGCDARPFGGRLLTSAANQGQIELVRLLLDHGAQAADAENLGPVGADRTIAQLLVARGFRLNVPIRGQETLLTMACRADKGEHPAGVAALLALGADPNAPNAKGRTPLEIATRAHFAETLALLRAAGAR